MKQAPGLPGEVPYHLFYVRWWRRQSYFWILQAVAATCFIVAFNHRWFSPFMAIPIFNAGATWRDTRRTMKAHQVGAWQAENTTALQAMLDSELYTPIEAVEALRDGPPIPGISRKDWVRAGNEAIEELRRELES